MQIDTQKLAFLDREGDEWFRRNRAALAAGGKSISRSDELLRRYVKPDARVLEIGCGDASRLARIVPAGRVGHGVDPSAEAVAAASRTHPHFLIEQGTADELPFTDASFDFVLFGFCLYLCDPALHTRIVSEADRVLATEGYLAILDFDPPTVHRRPYSHADGLFSYKVDYSRYWLAFPQYVLVEKSASSHAADSFTSDPGERIATSVLFKQSVATAFPLLDRSSGT